MSHISRTFTLRHRRVEIAQGLMRDRGDGLLAAASPLDGREVLVLGAVVASTMCALAVSECRRAESRLPGCRVEHGSADVVLVPGPTPEALPELIRQTTAGLRRDGLLAVRLPRSARDANEIRSVIAAAGFTGIREVGSSGERVLLARR